MCPTVIGLFSLCTHIFGEPPYSPSTQFAEALSASLSFPRKPHQDFSHRFLRPSPATAHVEFNELPLPRGEILLKDWPSSNGTLLTLEDISIVDLRKPEFVLNLSNAPFPPWLRPEQDLHGSYLVQRRDLILFGPNHLVNSLGWWACETRAFKKQFVDLVFSDTYNASFPGSKPTVKSVENNIIFNLDAVTPSLINVIDEPVFLGTPLEPDNWGRWLITAVPKVYQFQEFGRGRKFLCRVSLPWQRSLLRLLGISDRQIIDHDPGQTYFCRDVMTVDYSVTNMTVSAQERSIFLNMADRIYTPTMGVGPKIFISRHSRSK